jgi:hypothetical protein
MTRPPGFAGRTRWCVSRPRAATTPSVVAERTCGGTSLAAQPGLSSSIIVAAGAHRALFFSLSRVTLLPVVAVLAAFWALYARVWTLLICVHRRRTVTCQIVVCKFSFLSCRSMRQSEGFFAHTVGAMRSLQPRPRRPAVAGFVATRVELL